MLSANGIELSQIRDSLVERKRHGRRYRWVTRFEFLALPVAKSLPSATFGADPKNKANVHEIDDVGCAHINTKRKSHELRNDDPRKSHDRISRLV